MIRPHHLLRHIGRGKVTFRGLLLRISSKPISCKLTTVIRTESFDVRVVLILSTRGICPTDLKGFIFHPKMLKPSVASVVISKSHIIPTSSQAKSGRNAPNVRMDFFTRLGLVVLLAPYVHYLLEGCLDIFTKITNEGRKNR